MLIPGQNRLFSGSAEFPRCVLLLTGPSGSGKTVYSIQFLREGITGGDYCLYINCSPALSRERFNSYFANKPQTPEFLDLYSLQKTEETLSESIPADNGRTLSSLLEHITSVLQSKDQSTPTRVVVDSLTDIIARFQDNEVQKFVAGFYDFLKARGDTLALFTLTGTTSAPMADIFGSLVDGIIQLRMKDSGEEIQRDARILSLKAAHNTPKWVRFSIAEDGTLQFGNDDVMSKTELQCKLCHEPIIGPVVVESESPFHPSCLGTYHKLGEIYGSNIIYSLQPGVVNTSFFFIDIVGLSDPLLSVENQIRKIEDLNMLIGSCDAFSKVPKDEKIILPTGDGMAIGFLLNPELPLQLSIQLHHKLRVFNAKKTIDKAMGVRIGLSSGPVFIVTDINNNQNVWGPGIILARRVMDLGDSGHILLSENIAETLMNLKDEYREMIKPVSMGYKIKHGQLLKLYSACSQDFGNPAMPARILELG